ncbi:type III secretion inner membrane ring lipoprotein SctJ [Rhizobium sp. MC63]|uniref:Lipoprotein n=5 Tax=Rhizobium TaxID=379 RepID=A0A3S0STE4_9HYPH|nr:MULTISPECIES: type III secretion inner membrane ring lipoprotein SctJ [Rhizobium]MDC7746875.1 type III secretion inner membrane ring lipoprotein SctJ [Rhizobium sp. BC56]MDC9813351.1 type III secretion inner membrane ring lipoprotein SctJ [Rhizobium sp. MC62]MDC9837651.1 type III secretion inner membrane ring lipoprotein SctJ [Rhizobium sp. MJ37]MDE8763567.1 type III secretion inner membrane ring lipoprotein SctJ [Rhizobium sp. CBK13]MDF0700469.1 type III secretion inner membrane ring lipop
MNIMISSALARSSISSPARKVLPKAAMLALCLFLAACSQDVLTGLDQRDALDAQVLLERAGISVTMKSEKGGTYAIIAESADHARAIELLAGAGLPRQSFGNVAELFPGNGFLVTPYEQKARMSYAIEQQLAETLSGLDGVATARVHVVLPEENGRGLIKEKARAAAVLQYRPGANLNEIDMKSRSVLVNSIRDLSYEDVSVVVSPWSEVGAPAAPATAAAPAPAAPVTPAPAAAPFSMVQSALSAFKGPNLAVIGAIILAIGACLLLLLPQRKER